MEKEVIEKEVVKVFLREDSISRVIFLPKVEVTLDDAIKIVSIRSKLSKGKKYPVLVDTREMSSINRAARQHFSGEEAAKITSALGFLVMSLLSRVLVNLFLGINKPAYKTKFFTSEVKVIEWLKGYIEWRERTKEDSKDGKRSI